MFKIYDGREKFYQWDSDRKLIVDDASINEVHFCNKTDDCSLVCETYELDGHVVVDVPNILLQDNWRINVYAFDKKYTKYSAIFEVEKRTKPDDYVYTETETITIANIEAMIAEIEANVSTYAQEYIEAHKEEFKGEQGIQGEKGDTGAKGDKGEKGDTGAQGIQGERGLQGAKGEKGDKGAKGDKGDTGATGAQGKQGVKGDKGEDGVDGKDGESGVYVGNTEPTDAEMLIWINPDGAADEDLATTTYVNEAIAAALDGIAIAEEGTY